jgi:hypothetical protein
MAKAEGIPPSASVASVGLGIRYIGQFCYAYSPHLTITTAAQTILEFTTGDGVIMSRFQFFGPMDFDDPANGHICAYEVALNNEVVAVVKCDNAASEGNYQEKMPIVLPPFTTVKIRVDSNNVTTDYGTNVMMTGRVYDA